MLKKLVFLSAFLLTGLLACSADNTPVELFIAYGRTSWPDGDCTLLIVNPAQSTITQHQGHPSCNYGMAKINGKKRLIAYTPYQASSPNKSEIVIYDVSVSGEITIKQTIRLDGIQITSMPQWGSNGWIYMSGIAGGNEQIYRYHTATQELFPYINVSDGFTTAPQISPTHNVIVYKAIKGFDNHTECRTECPVTELLVWDINSGASLSLTQLTKPFISEQVLEQFPVYCHELWSPEGTYFAFEVGCGVQGERLSFVYESHTQNLAPLIVPNPYKDSSVRKWLMDNKLLLYTGGAIEYPNRDAIYSVQEKSWELLPVLLIEDSLPVFFDDWTNDALRAIGQTTLLDENGNDRNAVVIMNLVNNREETVYIQIPNEDRYIRTPVIWSPTGKWAMYASYRDESINRFSILTWEGKLITETGLQQMFSPAYFWLDYTE